MLILKSTLNIWKQCNLSIKGKITVLNTLALSPLTYVSSVISTPIRVFKEIDEITQDFIWNSKTSKISKGTLTQSTNNGGLKMCNFKLKSSALQLFWIKRLTNNTNDSWKVLPKYFYKCKDLLTYFNSNQPLFHNKHIPVFYQTIHQEYMKYFKLPPTNIIEAHDQSNTLQ